MKRDRSHLIRGREYRAFGLLGKDPSGQPRSTRFLDAILISGGVACAGASVVFAAYMLGQDIRHPHVRDIQYLALFAQPSRTGVRTEHSARAAPLFGFVDMTPTGSIPSATGLTRRPAALRIVGGHAGIVYMTDGTTIRAVRPGDSVPGLGKVVAVTERDGSWALLGRDRHVLMQQRNAGYVMESSPAFFSKPLIFGAAAR